MQKYGRMEVTYKDLKPFISIWLIMNGPVKYQNSIRIYWPKERMIYGNRYQENINHKMKGILIYLGKEINEENKLLSLFGTLFSMDLSYEEKIDRLNKIDAEFLDEEIEKEVNTMCNLGEMLQEESINKGIKIGQKEGLLEGREEGLQEGKMNATFNDAILITKKLHFDFKRALILLDITNPKEQAIYLEKYKHLNNNH